MGGCSVYSLRSPVITQTMIQTFHPLDPPAIHQTGKTCLPLAEFVDQHEWLPNPAIHTADRSR